MISIEQAWHTPTVAERTEIARRAALVQSEGRRLGRALRTEELAALLKDDRQEVRHG